jgi:hypothetical protein
VIFTFRAFDVDAVIFYLHVIGVNIIESVFKQKDKQHG